MPRHQILGTAGHIDHGKTTLVKALTGTDCDRLPEEQARGVTIDIGFAQLKLGDVHLGVVDVPGHERFVRNMLAGAAGLDLALLVVAADDSVMPQTVEHLEVLKLLGLRRGAIALTKCDLVDDTTREVVALEVRELVRGTFLADAPLVPVSAAAGTGLDALRAALLDAARQLPDAEADGPFRLAIDRAFVVQGHGTVVTGSVTSGRVRAGDELEWFDGTDAPRRVRVRGLHSHDAPVEEAVRGQRAALNLAGVPHEEVVRGHELATPGWLLPSRVLTVRLSALPATAGPRRRPLRHRLPVRLHIGTAEVMAEVALLDADALNPGASALAQLFLATPVPAVWGQPFVLRESAATLTLGGGRVLQPVARKLRRRDADALARLAALESDDPAVRADAAAWFRDLAGVTAADLARDAGAGAVLADGGLVVLGSGTARRIVHADRAAALEARVMAAVEALHAEQPLLTSHERARVFARLAHVASESLLSAVADRLVARGELTATAGRLACSGFRPKLSANMLRLKETIVEAHRAAEFHPPEPASFAAKAGGNAGHLGELFDVCVAEGVLVRVADGLYLHTEAEAEMRRRLTERFAAGGGLTVAEIRDLLGTSRKYAVPLCEYLDRVGLTRREGDLRLPATGA
jgi:selenocysteine-specific elongation factor